MDTSNTQDSINIGGQLNSTNQDGYREEYERNLKRVQKEHLDRINHGDNLAWSPCLHDQCPSCHGTGLKLDGSLCIHNISCPCPKCSPRY